MPPGSNSRMRKPNRRRDKGEGEGAGAGGGGGNLGEGEGEKREGDGLRSLSQCTLAQRRRYMLEVPRGPADGVVLRNSIMSCACRTREVALSATAVDKDGTRWHKSPHVA